MEAKRLFMSICIFIFCGQSSADDWFCKQESSIRTSSNSFTICGVANGLDLQSARDGSLNAALGEWARLSRADSSIRDLESSARPGRTDCYKTSTGYECVRAIEFIISETPKRNLIVDSDALQRSISDKQEELSHLQEKLRLQSESADLDRKIAQAKLDLAGMNDKFVDSKNDIPAYRFVKRSNWGLEVSVQGSPVQGATLSLAEADLFWDNSLTSYLGMRTELGIMYGYGGTQYPSAGSQYQYSLAGFRGTLGLPIILRRYTVKPFIGLLSSSYSQTSAAMSGNALVGYQSTSAQLNQTVSGLAIEYSFSRWFLSVEARKYQDSNGQQGNLTGGISIGYFFGW